MQNWLNNLFKLGGTGLGGEKQFYQTGYDATKNLASDTSNVLGTQASLAFQGERQEMLDDQRKRHQMLQAAELLGKGLGLLK